MLFRSTGLAPLEGAPFPIGATTDRERFPAVTDIGGRTYSTRGQGWLVTWSVRTAGSPEYDLWGSFIPEILPPVTPPSPLALGVQVLPAPDASGAPFDTVSSYFKVRNTGSRRDAYRMDAVGLVHPWLSIVNPLVSIEPGDSASVLVRTVIPGNAGNPDSNWISLGASSATDSTVLDSDNGRVRVPLRTGVAARSEERRVGKECRL